MVRHGTREATRRIAQSGHSQACKNGSAKLFTNRLRRAEVIEQCVGSLQKATSRLRRLGPGVIVKMCSVRPICCYVVVDVQVCGSADADCESAKFQS